MNTTTEVKGYSDKSFLYTAHAAVTVPLLQSAVTAGLVFILIVAVIWIFDWWDSFAVLMLIPLIAGASVWWSRLSLWVIRTTENIVQRDIDGDGQVGEPEPVAPRVVKVQVTHIRDGGYVQVDQIDLPATDEQLKALAEGFKLSRPFSERQWAGAGKPFTSSEFRSLRSVMLKRDLIVPVNERDLRQGFRLTEAGQAVMNKCISPTE